MGIDHGLKHSNNALAKQIMLTLLAELKIMQVE